MEKYMFKNPFLLSTLEKVLASNGYIGKDYILSSYKIENRNGTDTAVLIYSMGVNALDYFKMYLARGELYVMHTVIDRSVVIRALEVAYGDEVARLTLEKSFQTKLFSNALRAKNDMIFGSNKQNHQMLREYYDISEMYPEETWADLSPEEAENLSFSIQRKLEVVR